MTDDVKLSLIVARGRNGVIGNAGTLPWRLKSDLAFFKRVTLGKPIIMGRKTWESLPRKPLPGRENIVLTRDWYYKAEGARVYSSFDASRNAAKAVAKRESVSEVFVIGGATIYADAIGLADRLYLTDVDAAPEGDVFFPPMDDDEWTEVSSQSVSAGEHDDHAFVIRTLDRA
jgi:dihydrofolate reductase